MQIKTDDKEMEDRTKEMETQEEHNTTTGGLVKKTVLKGPHSPLKLNLDKLSLDNGKVDI
jgi:DNA-binding protein YbaB